MALADTLAIKSGEVFKRASAAGDYDQVDEIAGVEFGERGLNFRRRCFALNRGRTEQDVQSGVAATDNVEEVADDGACGRRNDAHGAGKHGQRPLAIGVEEAFGFESLFQLFKRKLQ